ncbi:F-box/kelch-repeat protein At3g23880-like [Lycium barbarum]|uniref:F-box/kelch-repeat protein At3g23880-like n=1 Tax=Lycium barbarum TaxID=112863 RepID=UPI00293EFAA9|nr:F-box/kelch-repeat protein At3g23880-like [Lycium barbarum]XP_060179326.1 F-box/kelch-repeat protein At3g23880-like [Lycium barbarum]XP_060179327.1 F-box/kelch-repeat protein At3g23880-like [Lycium barbarum]XP_060179328.1 F-box/kelch-repeat protein At3g23880-like [Lycium barbarum]XP_060179329.1 F-box/kelch-repeat protein At3g23880-like [Lycium barbarum]XP_060179330.1 F-box/kelch-repeat protein At3g23880-like [Lycium barbarum]
MSDESAKLGSCSLPGDVILEILFRLPVKSLLRFQTVSKSWYAFLITPDFTQLHLRHTHEMLLRVSDRGPRDTPTISFFSLDHHKTTTVKEEIDEVYKIEDFADLSSSSVVVVVDLPFPCSPDDEVRVVGSCNGLLCVHFNRTSNIILWNPATRKYRFLESPDCVSFYSDPFFPYIMLGFVPETHEYKVVKVPSSSKNSNAKVWVYSMNSDSWEEIGADVLHGLLPKGGSAVTLNGCLYWMSYSNDNGRDIITSFDLFNQVFGKITLPNPDIVTNLTFQKLVVLKGCLSMIIYFGDGINVNHYEVWMMTKQQGAAESWTKQFDFSPFSKLARPVGSWRDSELLFGYPNGLSLELLSYNPFTKRTRSFQRRSLVGRFKVINYVESLESVEGS